MKMPLFGIDWTNFALLAALLLQVAFMLVFGESYDWFNQSQMWFLTGYVVLMCLNICPSLNIEALRVPLFCRGVAYGCVVLLMAFLFFDSPLRRHHPRLMQPWDYIGHRLRKHLSI